MDITNIKSLVVYQNEDNSRELNITIDDSLSDCDIYIDFEKPDGTKSKVLVTNNTYLIPKALIDIEGYIKCQVVAYRGLTFIEKSMVYKFYVGKSINATEYIVETQPDVIEQLENEKVDTVTFSNNTLQFFANDNPICEPIELGGTDIDVSEFQKALQNISGHYIDHTCTTVNEVLIGINSFYEVAKIIVDATDSVGNVLTGLTITISGASDYKREDGYYYLPASDTEWTMRVQKSGYYTQTVVFTVSTADAQAGEKTFNVVLQSY